MTGSHVLVESLDGVHTAHLTELLVHVVSTGARVVAEPDTKVLDLEGTLLVDLETKKCQPTSSLIPSLGDSSGRHLTYHIEADDLTVGLLDLPELSQEVPEPRLGHDRVGRKDAHAVELGRGVGLGGQVTPNNLVLSKTPCCVSVSHGCHGIVYLRSSRTVMRCAIVELANIFRWVEGGAVGS